MSKKVKKGRKPELISKSINLEDNLKIQEVLFSENILCKVIPNDDKTVDLVDKVSNKCIMRIEKLEMTNSYKDTDAVKIPYIVPLIDTLVRCMPSKLLLNEMGNMWKVVYPKGSIGELMKYNNGLRGTPLIDGRGYINSHAGIEKVHISAVPFSLLNIMSVVTGQIYLNSINSSLEMISNNIHNLISMYIDEKESNNFSEYKFIENVYHKRDAIYSNQYLRMSTLINIQRNNIDFISSIEFYKKSIKRSINKINIIKDQDKWASTKLDEVIKEYNHIHYIINQIVLCYNAYLLGKSLELYISEAYMNVEICRYYNKEMQELSESIINNLSSNHSVIAEALQKIDKDAVLCTDRLVKNKQTIHSNFKFFRERLEINLGKVISNIEELICIHSKNIEIIYIDGNIVEIKTTDEQESTGVALE